MITDRAGTPISEVLRNASLNRRDSGRRPTDYVYYQNDRGDTVRDFRVIKDRIGDIIRIYRQAPPRPTKYDGAKLRAIRAERGVGRPQWMWRHA